MLLANARIEIDARPAPSSQAVLEVVMIGHCPSAPDRQARSFFGDGEPHDLANDLGAIGKVNWDRLARDEMLLAEIAALGFVRETVRLRELVRASDQKRALELRADDLKLLSLYDLPIPLYSFGQFQSLFPAAFDTPTRYRTSLGGSHAWLPFAVQDFFENSGNHDHLKLWIIRVDEEEEEATTAFLPSSSANMLDIATLGAFERALLIPRAAILALPDLERLQIPAQLQDIPPVRLEKTLPAFLPCGNHADVGDDENASATAPASPTAPLKPEEIVLLIAQTLARLRPDMQCLFTVPLAVTPDSERPAPSQEFLEWIAQKISSTEIDAATAPEIGLRHLQLISPYLRGTDRRLGTAVGLVAGMQAAVSQRHGPWRSIGGQPLPGRALPWPPLSQHSATALRERPGVTALLHRAGRLFVDDERLCAPCLPRVALLPLTPAQRDAEEWRSAEILRFMGWLRRELQALGERMIFNVDPGDPRAELALRAFFNRLYTQGALRGARVEEAFTLIQRREGDNVVAFDIEIAPAFPIVRLRITFMQDRHGGSTTHIGMDEF